MRLSAIAAAAEVIKAKRLTIDGEAIPTGILLNEHIAEDGPTEFARACQFGPGVSCREGQWHVSMRPMPHLDQGPLSRQHLPCSGSGATSGIAEPQAAQMGANPPSQHGHDDYDRVVQASPIVITSTL